MENVKVYVRVRPPNERELVSEAYTGSSTTITSSQGSSTQPTISIHASNHVVITGGGGSKSDMFTYDCVGDEGTTQEQVFNDVGKRIVEQCVQGYNGTIFAYGQTGSGKTYTMQGPTPRPCVTDRQSFDLRGIIPRCLEYLFELISKEELLNPSVKYLCKASYIEIYNEAIYDLLDNSNVPRSTREDIKRGVYVDGICEESIDSPDDAFRLFEQGAANRHISATSMNRESSRSHTVLTLTIQSMTFRDGVHHIRESRFNLVDLAGSERQKLAQTEGMRLKEASNINKSLLCLGTVINALVEIASGNSRHVHYRDSKLTFLLKDSLGGNSNTFIIANVSPSPLCYQESLSTLRFAQRAKMIKNKAVVNEDIQGNVNELRAEIHRLKAQLSSNSVLSGSRAPASSGTSSSLLDDDNNEGYRRVRWLLVATEERLQKEQAAHLETQRKAFLLDDACKAREKQVQSSQLTLKLRDATIAQYRKGLTAQAMETERGVWEQEVAQLKRQLDFNPEVLKLRAENLALRDLLRKYEQLQEKLEDHEEAGKKEKEYQMNLSQHLIAVEHENAALRDKLAKEQEEDQFRFRLADEENIMHESPPNLRSGSDVGVMSLMTATGRVSTSSSSVSLSSSSMVTPDSARRFSSDTKSLLQRVTQSRKEELRRLSGSLKNSLGGGRESCGAGHGDDSPTSFGDVGSLGPTPPSWKQMMTSTTSTSNNNNTGGENLSESLMADALMHSEDTVEMTLLKRDVDRLKDENAMLLDDKKELESELSAAGFQLLTLEKSLEEVTRQAEEFARNLQEAQAQAQEQAHQQQQAQKQASNQIVENLKQDLQEHVRLMEEMQQVSLAVEEEQNRLRDKLQLVEAKAAQQDQLLEEKHKKLEDMQREATVADAELKTLRDQLATADEKVEFVQQEIQKLRQASLQHEADTLLLREQLQETQDQLSAKEHALQEAQRQANQALEDLRQQWASKEEATAAAVETLREQQEKLREEAESTQRALETQLEELRDKVASAEAELKTREATWQGSLEEQQRQVQMLKTQQEQATEQLEQQQAQAKLQAQEHEQTLQDKAGLEAKVEELQATHQQLSTQLEEAKLELQRTHLALQQAEWDKKRFESIKRDLREKHHASQRKLAETEHRLEGMRDEQRTAEAETRAIQEELEQQLHKTQSDLAVKVQETLHLEAYRKRFRELRAQFEGLGQTALSERARQEASFQEKELQRVMELEKMQETLEQYQVKQSQLEASLALAQDVNEQAQTLHEQVLEETKAGTRKIAEEMEKKLMELEAQRQEAEKQVEQLLEKEHHQTLSIQSIEEECLHLKEKIQEAEQRLLEERERYEKVERELEEARRMGAMAQPESHQVDATPDTSEDQISESSALAAGRPSLQPDFRTQQGVGSDEEAIKRQQLKEQLETQRQLLMRMKQEQQALIRQQQVEQRDKTMALFEGLATENNKLMEQVRDLGLVNERMMKHQNPKQKLQYHVKIKQENNELRIENQRLMFRAIELEERLGNKENVESLRKQAWAVHGDTPMLVARVRMNESTTTSTSSTTSDKGESSLAHPKQPQQQLGSDDTAMMDCLEAPEAAAAAREPLRSKSTPPGVSTTTGGGVITGRKRPSSSVVTTAPPSTRQRKLSTASSSMSAMEDHHHLPPPSPALSSTSSSTTTTTTTRGEGSARARAKAAADAALALKQAAGRSGSALSSGSSSLSTATGASLSAASRRRAMTPSASTRSQQQQQQQRGFERAKSQPAQGLRAVRQGMGGSQLSKTATAGSTRQTTALSSTTTTTTTSSAIGSASAQRALVREARRQAAATAVTGSRGGGGGSGVVNRLFAPTAASRARAATPSSTSASSSSSSSRAAAAAAARASAPPTTPRRTSARLSSKGASGSSRGVGDQNMSDNKRMETGEEEGSFEVEQAPIHDDDVGDDNNDDKEPDAPHNGNHDEETEDGHDVQVPRSRMEFLASPPPPPSLPLPPPATPSKMVSASASAVSVAVSNEAPSSPVSPTCPQSDIEIAELMELANRTDGDEAVEEQRVMTCSANEMVVEVAANRFELDEGVTESAVEAFMEVQEDVTGPLDDDVVLVKDGD
ncbi:Kinesin-like protein kif15 [Actinomortierella ambigua]|nr:Kinesin-like protein kif15 [Actinomortierella ambigua]